jgi:flagellar basal body-associated protein FliL
MAEDTQQAAATAGGEALPEKPKGGIKSFLPLILAVVLMPVMAVGTFYVKSKLDSKGSTTEEKAADHGKADHSKAESAKEPAHGEAADAEHGGTATKKAKRNTKVAVPLCRMPIAYKPKPDDKDSLDTDKYVVLDLKGEPKDLAEPEKIVVNVARTQGTRYAVARITMYSEAENFVEQVNLYREKLLDVAHGALSSKTLEELDTPGFKNVLKAELIGAFNRVFKANLVSGLTVDPLVQ